MFTYQTRLRNFVTLLAAALLLAVSASAETKSSFDLANIHIKNFGRTNDHYYRGAQPSGGDYADLAALGIKTVIDLTANGRDDEDRFVKRAGMTFYRIPLTTSEVPSAAKVTQFLKLVNDPANWPVFVHCQGGRHRTGTLTAVYRMTQDGWTADRAYQEMRQYRFEGFPGHPALKRFVYDYYTTLDQSRQAKALENERVVGISK